MNKGTVLYIGFFELPDKNAAAHRVTANAKILHDLGFRVVLCGEANSADSLKKGNIHKHKDYLSCNIFSKNESIGNYLYKEFSIDYLRKLLKIFPDTVMVIAYNLPAIALNHLRIYCKRARIVVLSDCTEWYLPNERNVFIRLLHIMDVRYRMQFVNKRVDGIIAISKYLYSFYKKFTLTIYIPPLVDISDNKWYLGKKIRHDDKKILVYAGSPSMKKERLDYVINYVISSNYDILLKIIGVDESTYYRIYGSMIHSPKVEIMGRIDHRRCIKEIQEADYSIIIREKNLSVEAGFPTKFVEAISAGTPVIATCHSDLGYFIKSGTMNGWLVSEEKISSDMDKIMQCNFIPPVDRSLFDYHKYIDSMQFFIDNLLAKKQ